MIIELPRETEMQLRDTASARAFPSVSILNFWQLKRT